MGEVDLKILQINSVCGTGSTGKIAVGIHNLLKSNGHDSCIAFGRGDSHNCDSSIKIGSRIDNYIHLAVTRIFDLHGFASKHATRKLIEKIKLYEPDIIHLHNIHGYYLNIKTLFDYLKSSNIPTVWTLHDCWPYTGHCAYYTFVECSKWKQHCTNCPAKRSYPSSILIDNSGNNFSNKRKIFCGHSNLTLVTPSYWLRKELQESFLRELPVRIINNGIDVSVFKSCKSDFRKNYDLDDKRIILGVANIWETRKGLSRFFDLASFLNENEMIVVVGKVPEKNTRLKIKALADKFVYIEQTDNPQQLAEIYSAADVYFNPTYEDNYPTTNLEALACGCPVITHNIGGSPESLTEADGLIVSMLSETSEIISNIRLIYSENNRFNRADIEYRANSKYSSHNKLAEYIFLYEDVMNSIKLETPEIE